jgi:hypothetical protein
MKAKILRKCLCAAMMSIGLATSAFAEMVTLDIEASGASFGNQATASGFITFDTALLPTIGTALAQVPLSPAVSNLQLTVAGAAEGGNGTFGLNDFFAISFSAPNNLDFSQQLIGQTLLNGCLYGLSSGTCSEGNAGDFNLFSAGSTAPNGTNYFLLTTASQDNLLITSLAPEAAVPEPTSVALFGVGLLGFAASRRKSAKRGA